jgi:hypothetical protein
MDRTSNLPPSALSHGSLESDLKTVPVRKRKSNGFRGALRRLFGRKTVKSRISAPTPSTAFGNVSCPSAPSVATSNPPA